MIVLLRFSLENYLFRFIFFGHMVTYIIICYCSKINLKFLHSERFLCKNSCKQWKYSTITKPIATSIIYFRSSDKKFFFIVQINVQFAKFLFLIASKNLDFLKKFLIKGKSCNKICAIKKTTFENSISRFHIIHYRCLVNVVGDRTSTLLDQLTVLNTDRHQRLRVSTQWVNN